MAKQFWNWDNNQNEKPRLRIEGVIGDSAECWFNEDCITAKDFRRELEQFAGRDVEVVINSYGGDVFAAATIYSDLRNFKGNVDVEIVLACSAASVIAMAGDTVGIVPTGAIMIHNPAIGFCSGDSRELQAVIKSLDAVKDTILNAYQLKTGLPRKQLSDFMSNETWFSPTAALEFGFVDKILYTDVAPYQLTAWADKQIYSPVNFERERVKNFNTRRMVDSAEILTALKKKFRPRALV